MTKEELNNELMTVIFVGEGNLEKVKELIAKGADAEYKDSDGWTPVYIATAGGHLNILKYLHEEKGAKVNIKDNENVTPLHIAARDARLAIVKYLLSTDNSMDVNSRDADGWTPLHFIVNTYNKAGSIQKISASHILVLYYLFFERNALMPIEGLFKYPDLIEKKIKRETKAQSIFDYFLQNKSNYTMKEIQKFKNEFLGSRMEEEDTRNLKPIVKFL